MNAPRGTTLGLVIVMGGLACSGQQAKVPFEKIVRDAQLTATLTLPGNDASSELYSSSIFSGTESSEPSGSSSSSGFIRPASPIRTHRPIASSFYLLNGAHLGMAVLDVELTQHCISTHQCREGNPLMPSSQAGALSMSIGLVGVSSWASYRLKKHQSNMWWVTPTGGIAGHVVGIATGLMHR